MVNIKHLTDANSIEIQKDPIHPDAYVISLPLDSEPSYIWHAYFLQELGASIDFWERKVFIIGKELKLVTTLNNIEGKLEWLENLVITANKRVEEYNKDARKRRTVEEITSLTEKTIRTALSRWLVKRVSA